MLVSKKINTEWNKRNRKYYIEKGYDFTGYGNQFEVNIEHIEKGSSLLIQFICDYCLGKNQINEKQRFKPYNNLIKSRKETNKDCCGNEECKVKKSREFYIRKLNENGKTIIQTHPHLIKEWSNRNETSPSQHGSGSRFKVLWECENGHEWYAYINDRCKRNSGCPYCSGAQVSLENSIFVTESELCKEWNYNKNVKISPKQVSKGSNKKVWWICSKGHEWEELVYIRINGSKCPICSSLVNTNPQLYKQWNYDKNKNIEPYNIVAGSGKKVWWMCEKGHEWKASVNSRNRGSNCPYCSGKKVCNDNCLATLRPDLAKEWDQNKNGITPHEITIGSSKKFWWICSECNHSWESTVTNRFHGNGCPQCKESKGEKTVRVILESFDVNFKRQYEFNNLIGVGGKFLRFDFAIFNSMNQLICLIEYDGEYHFHKFYEDDNHEIIVEHDRRKNVFCHENKIPLIRIPYWDFDNIKEIIIKELARYKLSAANS